MFNILHFLLVMDNAGRKLRPIKKLQNNLCKLHFTNYKSPPVLIMILLLAIYFNEIDRHSTFFHNY